MSSSSSSSSQEEAEGGVGRLGEYPLVGEPAAARMRPGNGNWPEPFVEALAVQVATNAAAENGRLRAGPALVSVFQVCSTWQAISRSELLWEKLTRRIWGRDRRLRPTWREEYVHRHRTSYNFRIQRAVYTPVVFEPARGPANNNDEFSCRCLALSHRYLAGGFLDGSVLLFGLPSGRHVRTFRPRRRDRFGPFSRAVAGIILHDPRIVFASLDGDIHVAAVHDPGPAARRAHVGNVVNDGTLVDFTGCSRWWVGLYAGVPGRAFHVWDAHTEELVFVGGSLTDPEAVLGWHLLTELTERVGRVRVSSATDSGVACTGMKVIAFDLQQHGLLLGEEEGIIVGSVDVSDDLFLTIDNRGIATVRRVRTFEEVSRFPVRRSRRILGCLNSGYAFVFAGGAIRAWDLEDGEPLYRLRERIGDATDLVADDDHVAGCSRDTGIHLWNFSAG
ncbi:transcriptional regulator STERILE APETALA-like [Aristolochia californica]|uniref:transcriptional regulator STERILE APETALA-like n=1 Tax=Aristolochia californica TaxID=171875 RepID=UPI0035D55F41